MQKKPLGYYDLFDSYFRFISKERNSWNDCYLLLLSKRSESVGRDTTSFSSQVPVKINIKYYFLVGN